MKNDRTNENKLYCATGLVRPKTTALFFDKLWVPYYLVSNRYWDEVKIDNIPKDILLNLGNQENFEIYRLCGYGFSLSAAWRKMAHRLKLSCHELGLLREMYGKMSLHFNSDRNHNLQFASNYIFKNCGIHVVPVFFDETEFEKMIYAIDKDGFNIVKSDILEQYRQNKFFDIEEHIAKIDNVMSEGYKVLLNSIPITIEEELSWSQVKDIRSDKKSFSKLKNLHNWANKNFKNKSATEVEDLLGNTIEEYKSALKKFGVKTAIGGFTSCVSSVGTLLGALGGNELAVAGAILSISTEAFMYLYGVKDDIKVIKNSPIAYYYNLINKKLK